MNDREAALEALEAALGYRFRRRELLERALRHRSAAYEQGAESNERLEFLGDAALSHAVAALLFARWPDAPEGELTRARAVLVREQTLADRAEAIGIAAAYESGGGLRRQISRSLLADALEATLGALLLDGGWRAFQAAVRRLLGAPLEDLDRAQLAFEEPKSALQERAQRRGVALPVYREVARRGPEHRSVYVFEVELEGRVVGSGEGSSKREAQQAAARCALEALGES